MDSCGTIAAVVLAVVIDLKGEGGGFAWRAPSLLRDTSRWLGLARHTGKHYERGTGRIGVSMMQCVASIAHNDWAPDWKEVQKGTQ